MKTKNMYPNLRAEMARKGIGIKEMSNMIGCTRDTMSSKLSGKTKISYEEASKIERCFFNGKGVKYLFDTLDENKENLT